jgi:hypothetical protein
MLEIDQLVPNHQAAGRPAHEATAYRHSIASQCWPAPPNLLPCSHQQRGVVTTVDQGSAESLIAPVDIGRMIGMTQRIHPAMPELKLKVGQIHRFDVLPLPKARDTSWLRMHRKGRDQSVGSPHRSKLPFDLSHMDPRLRGLGQKGVAIQQMNLSTGKQAPAKISQPGLTMDTRIRMDLAVMNHSHGPDHEACALFPIPRRGPTSLNRSLNSTLLEEPPDLPCSSHLPRTNCMTRKGESDSEDRIGEIHSPSSKVCR